MYPSRARGRSRNLKRWKVMPRSLSLSHEMRTFILQQPQLCIKESMVKEDPDFAKVQKRNREPEAISTICTNVIEQEKEWAKFLFKDGSMIGLNEANTL